MFPFLWSWPAGPRWETRAVENKSRKRIRVGREDLENVWSGIGGAAVAHISNSWVRSWQAGGLSDGVCDLYIYAALLLYFTSFILYTYIGWWRWRGGQVSWFYNLRILCYFVLTIVLSDEDDTAELLKELQKIKRERAEEAARREKEKQEEEERIRTENLMRGNPLLNQERGSFKVKRRYTV